MKITEVRINLVSVCSRGNERLQAFCRIVFDDRFVVHDLKVIEGDKGLFVAMPSRKIADHCHDCGAKNHLRARFCNQCGGTLDENRALHDDGNQARLNTDVAHPINAAFREQIESVVLASYADELKRSKTPGYISRADEFDAERDRRPETATHGPAEPPLRRSERSQDRS